MDPIPKNRVSELFDRLHDSVDSFFPETTTSETLRPTFEAAMFDVTQDAGGPLIVHEKYQVAVVSEGASIRFISHFRLDEEETSWDAVLEFVNRINNKLSFLRAAADCDPLSLVLDWHLPTTGGIPKKTLVTSLRFFNDLVAAIGRFDHDNILGA